MCSARTAALFVLTLSSSVKVAFGSPASARGCVLASAECVLRQRSARCSGRIPLVGGLSRGVKRGFSGVDAA